MSVVDSFVANARAAVTSVNNSFGRYGFSSMYSGQFAPAIPTTSTVSAPAALKRSAMRVTLLWSAAVSSVGASIVAVSTGSMPSSVSLGSTVSSMSRAVLRVGDHGDAAVEFTAFEHRVEDLVGLVGVGHPGDPGRLRQLEARRSHAAADDRGRVRVDRAQDGIVQEEPGDEEDVVVFGELDARGVGRRGPGRVDRREDELELPPVDAAVGVDVIGQRLIGGLVVAQVEVEADCGQRRRVDVVDADLDRVVGDAGRRPGDLLLGLRRGIGRLTGRRFGGFFVGLDGVVVVISRRTPGHQQRNGNAQAHDSSASHHVPPG